MFGTLTVTENLETGGYRLPPAVTAERIAEIFERFPSLQRLRKRFAPEIVAGLAEGGTAVRARCSSRTPTAPRPSASCRIGV